MFDSRLSYFSLLCNFFFRFVVFLIIFLLGLFSVILTAGPLEPLEVFAVDVFLVMFTKYWLILSLCMHCLSRYEALETSESTQKKSQNDRPSPEISQESRANLRVPARIIKLPNRELKQQRF